MQHRWAQWRPLRPYFGAFLGLGVALSFFGPALPTLRAQTGSTVEQMGVVFAAQSAGGLVGALLGGRLYRRFGGPHLIAAAIAALVVALAVMPYARELAVVVGLGALIGAGAGTMDVGANTLTPTLVPPEQLVGSMNALHTCFAVGAVATPLLVQVSLDLSDGLALACWVFVALFAAVGALIHQRDGARGAAVADEQHADAGTPPDRWRLALVGGFFLLYVGLEVCVGGWLATYADELGLAARWGSWLTALFWTGFLVGRVLMAWRGDHVGTGAVLWGSTIGSALLAVALAATADRVVATAVVVVSFGVVIAPQFATMLAHLHRVYPLTGPVTAWCIGGSAVGGLLLPPLVGVLFGRVGAAALPWTAFGAAAATALVLGAIDRWALAAAPTAAPA